MAGTSCHKKRESLLAFILLSVLFMGTDASIYSRSIALKTDTVRYLLSFIRRNGDNRDVIGLLFARQYIEWSEGPMFSSNSFPSGEAYIEVPCRGFKSVKVSDPSSHPLAASQLLHHSPARE